MNYPPELRARIKELATSTKLTGREIHEKVSPEFPNLIINSGSANAMVSVFRAASEGQASKEPQDRIVWSPCATRSFDIEHFNKTGEIKYLGEEEINVKTKQSKKHTDRLYAEVKTLADFDAIGNHRQVAEKYSVGPTTTFRYRKKLIDQEKVADKADEKSTEAVENESKVSTEAEAATDDNSPQEATNIFNACHRCKHTLTSGGEEPCHSCIIFSAKPCFEPKTTQLQEAGPQTAETPQNVQTDGDAKSCTNCRYSLVGSHQYPCSSCPSEDGNGGHVYTRWAKADQPTQSEIEEFFATPEPNLDEIDEVQDEIERLMDVVAGAMVEIAIIESKKDKTLLIRKAEAYFADLRKQKQEANTIPPGSEHLAPAIELIHKTRMELLDEIETGVLAVLGGSEDENH